MKCLTNRTAIRILLLSSFAIMAAHRGGAQESVPRPAPDPSPADVRQQPQPDNAARERLFTEEEITTTRIVPLEFANPRDLTDVLTLFQVQVIPNEEPKALVVSGPENAVQLAMDAILQLDMPPPPLKNIEVIVYLIVAGRGDSLPSGLEPLREQLDPVTTQLSQVFGFERFGLVDTILLRGRDGGSVEASGIMPQLSDTSESGGGAPSNYQVHVRELTVQSAQDTAARISLNGFMFGTDITLAVGGSKQEGVPQRIERRNMGISADLDVQEGQMAVVGKANLSADGDVVFVVVTAQVVIN